MQKGILVLLWKLRNLNDRFVRVSLCCLSSHMHIVIAKNGCVSANKLSSTILSDQFLLKDVRLACIAFRVDIKGDRCLVVKLADLRLSAVVVYNEISIIDAACYELLVR